ncbi:MAG: oligosaccharide flippase family protein [Methylohalobius sp.]|nr:oligosaccharide flippase family protein [Methylohalobius sp.]
MAVVFWKTWRPGKLARDTLVLSTWFGLRSLAQAALFFIVARALGSQGYGAFSAVLALVGGWACFSGLGGHVILMRDVARNPHRFASSFGATLVSLGVGTVPLFLLYLTSAWKILPQVSWLVVVFIGLGELVFWPITNIAICAYQGAERMGRAGQMMLAPVGTRLGGAVALLALSLKSEGDGQLLSWWAGLYAAASGLAAGYAYYRLQCDLGRPLWPGEQRFLEHLRAGWPFSLWGSAYKLYVDADKFLLAGLLSLEVAGVYSAAYRLVDLALIPLYSLLGAVAPRLFRAGAKGTSHALQSVFPLVVPALGYSMAVAVALTLAAPLLPHLLGRTYQETVEVVRWLAWLPLISLPRFFLNHALATSDAQTKGMVVLLVGALLNIGLNLWWIPKWGWQGAAAATYGAEAIMALLLFCMYLTNQRRTVDE